MGKKKKKKKCMYTITTQQRYILCYIYLKGSPGSIPFHERTPHETFPIKENVLFRNGGLPGLIGKKLLSLFLSSLLLIGYILVRLFA